MSAHLSSPCTVQPSPHSQKVKGALRSQHPHPFTPLSTYALFHHFSLIAAHGLYTCMWKHKYRRPTLTPIPPHIQAQNSPVSTFTFIWRGFLEMTHYLSPLNYLFSFFTFKIILVSGLFLDFSSFVNYRKYENMAYLLEGHPEGAHIDIGCYSACVKGTAAAQNNTWREGKDVCQTARQLLLCEMRRSQLFFSHAVIKMVKLCQNVISNKFTNNNIKRPK